MTRNGLLIAAVIGGLVLAVILLGEIIQALYPIAVQRFQSASAQREKQYVHEVAQRAFPMPKGYDTIQAWESQGGRVVEIASTTGASPDVIGVYQAGPKPVDVARWTRWLHVFSECDHTTPPRLQTLVLGMRLYRVYRVHCTGTYAFQQAELIVPRWPHPRTIVFARGRTGDWSYAPIVALGAIWK